MPRDTCYVHVNFFYIHLHVYRGPSINENVYEALCIYTYNLCVQLNDLD